MTKIEKDIAVALFTGPGAELAEDIRVVLENKIPYRKVNANELRNGVLEEFKLLIMSGGYTARYIPNLKPKGCQAVLDFLSKQHGSYLGICAGAYIAGRSELGISKSKMVRKSGIFNCEIKVCDLIHPIFKGLTEPSLTVYYQNGPHILPHKTEQSLALYEDNSTSIIATKNALLFSWHPEKLSHTIPILLNSIEYLLY